MSEGDSNFFSRWSRRKAEVREGAAVPDAAPVGPDSEPGQPSPLPQAPPALAPAAPPPTLAEVAALTQQSDYARFMARDVTPEVKQAALKKLFTDPHFNVMDGLDVYIDDYGKPDPLPEGMLRKMAQSHFMGLFDHEKTEDVSQATGAALAAAEADVALPMPPDVAAASPHVEPIDSETTRLNPLSP